MELATLPATSNKNKIYKHYTLNSYPVQDKSSSLKNEFYYVGRNTSHIEKLIRTFESGFATENCANAKAMLLRLQSQGHPAPHIIICESELGYNQISELRNFLNSHPLLMKVPFVIDGNGMNADLKHKLRSEKIADEVITLDNQDQSSIVSKSRFLNRTKATVSDKQWQKNIETSASLLPTSNNFVKRAFDILLSSLALIILSPVFLIIAIAIKIESRGPVFYVAKRAGRGYRIFNFYKFRTMIVGADEKINEFSHLNQYNSTLSGPKFYKIENDPRITKLGAFLRKTSLDELPQLINVLLGDMSLVGNRPLPLYEAATLTTDEWAKRFMAPAGITGLWQIKKRGNKDMSVEERINLDIYYASKYNFAYDLWIIAHTPPALLQKTNA